MSSIVTFTALSVILGSLPAGAETTGAAIVSANLPTAEESLQEPAATVQEQASSESSLESSVSVAMPAKTESFAKKLDQTAVVATKPQVEAEETLTVLKDTVPASVSEADLFTGTVVLPASTLPEHRISAEPVLDRSFSTAAADLNPAPVNTQRAGFTEKAPDVIAQIDRATRVPGNNFIGIGANIGDNEDIFDLVVLSKIRLFNLPVRDQAFSVSARPSIAFSNGILDIRVPATVEFKQPTLDTGEPGDRLGFFGGAGVALSIDDDDDTEFDFMLTGGADYLFTEDLTFTAMVNFLFLDDVDIEGQFGVGFNF